FVGAEPVPPGVFLVGVAKVYEYYRKHSALPIEEGVDLPAMEQILPAQHVAENKPGLFGGWIIHKEGFCAPKVLEIARLQAWTLKPATPRRSATSGKAGGLNR